MKEDPTARAVRHLRSIATGLQDDQITALASLNPSPAEIELAALQAAKGELPVPPGSDIRMPVVERIYTAIRATLPDEDR